MICDECSVHRCLCQPVQHWYGESCIDFAPWQLGQEPEPEPEEDCSEDED